MGIRQRRQRKWFPQNTSRSANNEAQIKRPASMSGNIDMGVFALGVWYNALRDGTCVQKGEV